MGSRYDHWEQQIDEAAEAANEDMRSMGDLFNRHVRNARDHQNAPDLMAAIGVNIASQLAYANTLAVADFHMRYGPPIARPPVARRADGVCAGCGHDTPGHHDECPYL